MMKRLLPALLLGLITACGNDGDSKNATPMTAPLEPTWAQAQTALAANCSGTSCHSTGATNSAFVSDQALVTAIRSSMLARINDGTMPPAGWNNQYNQDVVVNYLTNTLGD